MAIQIDPSLFLSRLERLFAAWTDDVDALVVSLGVPSDVTVYQKSTALFIWLLGYEFPETIMLIRKKHVAFLTSQKKGAILEALRTACGKGGGPKIEIIKRASKDDIEDRLFEQLWKIVDGQGAIIGYLPKDKADGALCAAWNSWFERQDGRRIDVASSLVAPVLAVKDAEQLLNAKIAATMSAAVLEGHVMQKVLCVIDEGRRVSHARLSEEIEGHIVECSGKEQKRYEDLCRGISKDFSTNLLDICYQPIIQSGGVYSLKPSAVSTDAHLCPDVIVVSLGVRYRSVCSNVGRTVLIDPTPEQEAQLAKLLELRQHLLALMRPGLVLGQVYQEAHRKVAADWPELEKHLSGTLGFGMGLEFREADYQIGPKCQKALEAGMVFNLAIGFQDLSKSTEKYSLFIADTVVIEEAGGVILTDCLGYAGDLVYSLKERRSNPVADTVTRTRLRTQQQVDATAEKRRKEHQRELLRLCNKEAIQRYSSHGSGEGGKKGPETIRFESYRKDAQLPRDQIKDQQIFVDKRNESILLPIYGVAVPFHIATVKNVTKSDEGDYTLLRFNFATPTRTTAAAAAGGSDGHQEDPQAHYLRAITLRSPDAFRMVEVYKEIQELRKSYAEREAARKEMSDLVEQAQLIELSSSSKRPPRLADIYIRPTVENKRLPGDVEIHQNGLRYKTQLKSDQRVDILFSNIQHFIMQPCDRETIVVLHLHLHHPIIVGKRKTKDIQFFREALESLVDETSGRRNRMRWGDEDEIAQEREERKRRAEANAEFKAFAEKAVEMSGKSLDVEIPYRELGFTGVFAKQNVLLQPTTECLVQVVEPPFLVVPLADIEIAYLERVMFGLKNFDLVLVYKNHQLPPVSVNSVPVSSLEPIKEWLDSVDVLFAESKVNFNWTNILKMISQDPLDFYETGGWANLQPDSGEAGISGGEEDSDEPESSEYEPDDDEDDEEEEEESEESEEDDEEEEEYEDSEEEEDEDSDASEEEGPDWDELEAEAARQDAQRDTPAVKRKAPVKPAPAKASRK